MLAATANLVTKLLPGGGAVAEVGDQDVWQSLHIGISAVGSDRPYIDGLMTKVVDAIDRMNLAEIVDCKTETLNMGSGNY